MSGNSNQITKNINVELTLPCIRPPYGYGCVLMTTYIPDVGMFALVRFWRKIQISSLSRRGVRYGSEEWRLMNDLDGKDVAYVPVDKLKPA